MSNNPYKDLPESSVYSLDRAQYFWNELSKWAQATFGPDQDRGPLGPLKHLEKEAREAQTEAGAIHTASFDERIDSISLFEMRKDLYEEIADCQFLVFDAAIRAGMTYDDFLDVVFRKLEKNKARKWGAPSPDGVVEHVRDAEGSKD